jgi:polyhydroxybutyrate depolymerase
MFRKFCALWIIFTAFSRILLSVEDSIQLDVDGHARKYLVYSPMNAKGHRKRPLVLFLHGAGGTAQRAMENYGWLSKAKEESFIVAFPQALPLHLELPSDFKTNPNVWNNGSKFSQQSVDDILFLRKVIEDISKRYRVDSKRIYVTGFSNGASMAFRVGIDLSDIVAAIAPVSGPLWIKNPQPKRRMSALLITGADDPLNPLTGEINPNGMITPPMIDSVITWAGLLGFDASDRKVEEANGVKTIQYGPDIDELTAIFMVIAEQGHEWPGGKRTLSKGISGNNVQSFHATDVIWDFFTMQSLRAYD